METQQQKKIRDALEHASSASANSQPVSGVADSRRPKPPVEATLGRKSLRRASQDYVPRTLTPHEWEDYYRERGVPDAHRRGAKNANANAGSGKSLIAWLKARFSLPGQFPDIHSQ